MPGYREAVVALMLAACAPKARLVAHWTVGKRAGACSAEAPEVYAKVPPRPHDVVCPAEAREDAAIVVGALADGTCAILPEGCTSSSCATTTTSCLSPTGHETWVVSERDGSCVASWELSAKMSKVPCPFSRISASTYILRTGPNAPCFAHSGESHKPVPCPQ